MMTMMMMMMVKEIIDDDERVTCHMLQMIKDNAWIRSGNMSSTAINFVCTKKLKRSPWA